MSAPRFPQSQEEWLAMVTQRDEALAALRALVDTQCRARDDHARVAACAHARDVLAKVSA